MEYSVVIVAAGKGTRLNLGYNKVFYRFEDGETVLEKTLSVFKQDQNCKQIIVVLAPEELTSMKADKKITLVSGGATRSESVYHGLMAAMYECVYIHDAARPYINLPLLNRLNEAMKDCDGCIAGVPCVDTIKQVKNGIVVTLPREELFHAQTPQVFKTNFIIDAYRKMFKEGFSATDDASVVEYAFGYSVKNVLGDYNNIKITNPKDVR